MLCDVCSLSSGVCASDLSSAPRESLCVLSLRSSNAHLPSLGPPCPNLPLSSRRLLPRDTSTLGPRWPSLPERSSLSLPSSSASGSLAISPGSRARTRRAQRTRTRELCGCWIGESMGCYLAERRGCRRRARQGTRRGRAHHPSRFLAHLAAACRSYLPRTSTPIIDGHVDLPEFVRVKYGNNISSFGQSCLLFLELPQSAGELSLRSSPPPSAMG